MDKPQKPLMAFFFKPKNGSAGTRTRTRWLSTARGLGTAVHVDQDGRRHGHQLRSRLMAVDCSRPGAAVHVVHVEMENE